ncbi:MAG: electron transfer flavoprotein alpha subunit [Sphingobacteriales bacterium]|jgi:electron transfer flavoprotein alpha subunit
MSVLVYTENSEGKFKKSSFEVVSYAADIAKSIGSDLTVISIGNVSNDELEKLGNYGAKTVLSANSDQFSTFRNQSFSNCIGQAAEKMGAKVVVIPNSLEGRAIAPRIAVKLNAGFANGAIALPETSGEFKVKTVSYSNKAFSNVSLTSDVKVITLNNNSYKVVETGGTAAIEKFDPSLTDADLAVTVTNSAKNTDKISLPDADLVVSAGRGLKGPENWGMIEELAELLGAATACSKPVSDADWRPHSEHVGQTGIKVSPNLYIAIGISGAIQHLAGVSSSKTIVVINKDPEAPFFKAADYGIVGDAFEIVPKLIEELKSHKAATA